MSDLVQLRYADGRFSWPCPSCGIMVVDVEAPDAIGRFCEDCAPTAPPPTASEPRLANASTIEHARKWIHESIVCIDRGDFDGASMAAENARGLLAVAIARRETA